MQREGFCGEQTRLRAGPPAALLAALILLLTIWAGSARAGHFLVTSLADDGTNGTLRWAIEQVNSAGTDSLIEFDPNLSNPQITLNSQLPVLNNASITIMISGAGLPGLKISGNDQHQIFFVQSGTAHISNITLADGLAKGGNGGLGGARGGGGGGGLGAGGALFVNGGAQVTVNHVSFIDNTATGGTGGGRNSSATDGSGGGGGFHGDGGSANSIYGTGGGGGFIGDGGRGGSASGGGGGGILLNGGDGIAATPGNGGGSQGGAGGSPGNEGNPANGAGGGGGGGGHTAAGGNGADFGGGGGGAGGRRGGHAGFGAGSGGSGNTQEATPGFGGGAGGTRSGGNGGSGFGGAVFVRDGGTLTIQDSSFQGSNVNAGPGGTGYSTPGNAGTAAGTALYLHDNTATTIGVSTGQAVLADTIAGTGALVKDGAGELKFDAAQSYTGGTTVSGGRLSVNANLAGPVQVDAGATLGGVGTLAGPVTIDGTLTPGNSIGTINIHNDLSINTGANTNIEIAHGGTTPGVNNDLIAVQGNVNLEGTVNVQAAPGSYTSGSSYTFLTFTGTRTGKFAGITDDLPMLDAALLYGSNDVAFELLDSGADYRSIASTFNQIGIANYLDAHAAGATGDFEYVLDELNTLNTSSMQSAFDQMTFQAGPTIAQLGVQNSTFQYLLLRRRVGTGLGGGLQTAGGIADSDFDFDAESPNSLDSPAPGFGSDQEVVLVGYNEATKKVTMCRCRPRSQWAGWVAGYGLGGNVQGDGNAGGATYGLGGTLLAAERYLGRQHALGIFGSYSHMNMNVGGPQQWAMGDDGQIGSYLIGDNGVQYGLLAGSVGLDNYRATRQIQFADINRTANGVFSGWQTALYGERGVRLRMRRTVMQPFVGLQYIYLRQNAFTERGADSLNLAVDGSDTNALRGLLGTRVAQIYRTRRAGYLLPEVRAIWLHEFLDPETSLNARFAGIGGASFATRGLNYGRDWAVLGTGLNWVVNRRLAVYAGYDAQVNERQTFHVGSGGFVTTW